MIYEEIKTRRLSDEVSQQLKESMFKGLYQPGERMPSEHQLRRALVSEGPSSARR